MNNTLVDLNNYLFQALEEISSAEDKAELDDAIHRAKAIRDVGTVIVNNASVMVKALKYKDSKISADSTRTERLLTGESR